MAKLASCLSLSHSLSILLFLSFFFPPLRACTLPNRKIYHHRRCKCVSRILRFQFSFHFTFSRRVNSAQIGHYLCTVPDSRFALCLSFTHSKFIAFKLQFLVCLPLSLSLCLAQRSGLFHTLSVTLFGFPSAFLLARSFHCPQPTYYAQILFSCAFDLCSTSRCLSSR